MELPSNNSTSVSELAKKSLDKRHFVEVPLYCHWFALGLYDVYNFANSVLDETKASTITLELLNRNYTIQLSELNRAHEAFKSAYALVRVVQAHRTYTKHTSTEIARCVGCFCTSSGWFKHSEPPRTYTLNTLTELARCVGCLCTSSGWFKHSEPHRTYTSLTITELARCIGYFCTRAGWFKHVEPLRTYTNHTITELARCVGCCCTSSGGSSTSNLHEPHPLS